MTTNNVALVQMLPNMQLEPVTISISKIDVPDCSGVIGVARCPGLTRHATPSLELSICLPSELREIRHWGASMLICLLHRAELESLGVVGLVDEAQKAGLEVLRIPLMDCHPPDAAFMASWPDVCLRARSVLERGEGIFIHCRSGMGRSPLVASMLLIAVAGFGPREALDLVEAAHPPARGALSFEQEDFLMAWGACRLSGVHKATRLSTCWIEPADE